MKKVLSTILAFTFVFLMIQPMAVPASAALWVPVTSVKLNAASAKWAVGKSGALIATVLPASATNKAVSWKSSNIKAVTIDSAGNYKAVGVGSATITCTSKSIIFIRATCTVTVGKPVTSITLNTAGVRLAIAQTTALKATVAPNDAINKTVTWKSNDVKVATVDSTGLVKGIAAGATIITCTANDGSRVSTSCGVTVGSSSLGGFLSYMFDPVGNFFYTASDPWQRQFGFSSTFDELAPLFAMYYSTVRVKFTYDNLDWMIQLWKGQYGFAFIGSEMGVYTKPLDRTGDQYDAASDANSLQMGMTLYQKKVKLFTRDYDTYWWATGFVPGSLTRYADRTELTLVGRITLKDADMTAAFVQSLAADGFKYTGFVGFTTPDTYTVRGNDIFINWKNIEQ